MQRLRFAPVVFAIAVIISQLGARPTAVDDTQPAQLGAHTKKEKDESGPPPLKLIKRLGGFSEWVTSVAFSPDGNKLAAGSYETVVLFNPADGKSLGKIPIPTGYVKSLAFSRDGQLLVTGSYQTLAVWDAATLKSRGTISGHTGFVTGIAVSPDGSLLATSSDDESIRLWSFPDMKPGAILLGHEYPVQSICFSPDGKLLATAAGDPDRVTRPGEVKVWDVAAGTETLSFVDHKKAATDAAFSPDGKFLLSTSLDETINVYDLAQKKAIGFFGGHSRPTNCVLFLPDGTTVASASGGRAKGLNEIKLWDRATGEEKASIEGHKARISRLALAPNGTLLASAGYDNTVALWDLTPFVAATKSAASAATTAVSATPVSAAGAKPAEKAAAPKIAVGEKTPHKTLRVGIIGLDTSHAIAYTESLNDPKAGPELADCRVVAAYPKGSPDIESSTSRVPGYIETVKKQGVEIVDSIDALLGKVDVVLLETNDGRPHLEQVLPVFKAGKPVFVDKPVAGTLVDAVAVYKAAERYRVPLFSASSLRYGKGSLAVRGGSIGAVKRCETYSPCHLEKTHPDLFWYGIHGVESLFTVMGTGCVSVKRLESTPEHDFVEGHWDQGRVGIFRGYREGDKSGYGGSAEGEKGKADVGQYDGYRPLIVEIVKFFRTGISPVSPQETLEIYAFMEAADESKRRSGAEVTLTSVLATAYDEADKKLAPLFENQLTPAEVADGWQLLFNGRDYTGWKCDNGKPIASTIEDASLVPYKAGGYLIVHEKQFADFILSCDVKMDAECNSGIFFRTGNLLDPVQTGIEVQVETGTGHGLHDFGALYDLVPCTKNLSRGAGHWDSVTITCQGPRVTVNVNGEDVSSMNLDEWTEPGKRPDGSKHKFALALKDFPRKGYLGLQDHGHKVWFKNVRVKDLSGR